MHKLWLIVLPSCVVIVSQLLTIRVIIYWRKMTTILSFPTLLSARWNPKEKLYKAAKKKIFVRVCITNYINNLTTKMCLISLPFILFLYHHHTNKLHAKTNGVAALSYLKSIHDTTIHSFKLSRTPSTTKYKNVRVGDVTRSTYYIIYIKEKSK